MKKHMKYAFTSIVLRLLCLDFLMTVFNSFREEIQYIKNRSCCAWISFPSLMYAYIVDWELNLLRMKNGCFWHSYKASENCKYIYWKYCCNCFECNSLAKNARLEAFVFVNRLIETLVWKPPKRKSYNWRKQGGSISHSR